MDDKEFNIVVSNFSFSGNLLQLIAWLIRIVILFT